jgi:hypothetical protein
MEVMSDKFLMLLSETIDFYLLFAGIHANSNHYVSDDGLYRLEMIEEIAKSYHSNIEVVSWFNTPQFYCIVDGYLCSYGREDIDFGPFGSLGKEHIHDTIESAIGSFVITAYDNDSDGEDEMIQNMDECLDQERMAMYKTLEHFQSQIEEFDFTNTIKPESD